MRVVLFSGGRGSGALAELLATDPRIALTVVINGYDDGASTGEVRRFLGDALGPSDFRKNASRLARLRGTAPEGLIAFLDHRLPEDASAETLTTRIDTLERGGSGPGAVSDVNDTTRAAIVRRLRAFEAEARGAHRRIDYRGANVGNFVFAGSFLVSGRRFNDAVDDYAGLLGLPPRLIENVTDGTNAFLAAIDSTGRLLGSEEEIVDARRQNHIRDIYLIDRTLTPEEREALAVQPEQAIREELERRRIDPPINPRLLPVISSAHLIIYAPGTQHSSLFPSYLTPGLSDAVAGNLEAIKLLVTNIETDAEIAGSSAVDIIERAMFYLRDQGRKSTPTPCLITHYLLNDPGGSDREKPYVPLGSLDSLEDPRLVRVTNYEAPGTGRQDAAKVLAPFVDGFIARRQRIQKVAVLLYETDSRNKVAQTLLEMVRGGIGEERVDLTVFHEAERDLDPAFVERLGFPVRRLAGDVRERDTALRAALSNEAYTYVVLFDSSGMYNGEDIVGLTDHLRPGRLDAVWGSRRLSVRDIQESIRIKYRHKAVLGAVSAVGSHVLSLLYLALYGRYISDTLSAARAVRVADALSIPVGLTHVLANPYLLSTLLRRRAEMLEVPVQFFPISPDKVRRTSVLDGLRAMGVAVRLRA